MSRFALVLAACCLMVACSTSGRPAQPTAPPAGGTRPAAEWFLNAWQHSLTSSWSVQDTFERTTGAGQRIAFPERRAQRPPDHLNTGLGTVDARFDDRLVTCDVGTTGHLQCITTGAVGPYATMLTTQIALLRTYVTGPTAIYRVARLGSCFELQLRLASFPLPPYGRMAMFCFDPTTGAPAGTVIARDEGTDRTVVVEAHSPAAAADLALPTSEQMAAIAKLVPKPPVPTPTPKSHD